MASRCLGFATFILTASILVLGISAQFECGGDFNGIVYHCKPFVLKDGPTKPPSDECCTALNGVDVSCYCQYVTPRLERNISIDKALNVARNCELQDIPRGQCGSKLFIIFLRVNDVFRPCK